MAEEVPFREIAKGAMSGFMEPAFLVITNQAQWKDIWAKHSARRNPPPQLPAVDFDKESIVLVALGRKTSGGYSISVQRITPKKEGLVIEVTSREPAPGALTLQSLTAPFQIVAFESTGQKTRFLLNGKELPQPQKEKGNLSKSDEPSRKP